MASGHGPDQGSALLGAGWCTASSPDISEMDRVLMVTSSLDADNRRIGWEAGVEDSLCFGVEK
jgi:hypothetical protein